MVPFARFEVAELLLPSASHGSGQAISPKWTTRKWRLNKIATGAMMAATSAFQRSSSVDVGLTHAVPNHVRIAGTWPGKRWRLESIEIR